MCDRACTYTCRLVGPVSYFVHLFIPKEIAYHGIDWDGPLPDAEDVGSVEVPAIPVPLENEDME